MKKSFHLYRNLKPGMEGEDVKKLQHWLNILNLAYSFSKFYPNGVPENGKFQTFILSIYYHECLDMLGYPTNHIYDKTLHEEICYNVNMALQSIGDHGTTWVAN